MIERGVGLLRTLDPPRRDRLRALRLTAHALGVNWPTEMDYDDFVRGLDPRDALHAVMLHQAARVTGGARYVAFVGEPPQQAQGRRGACCTARGSRRVDRIKTRRAGRRAGVSRERRVRPQTLDRRSAGVRSASSQRPFRRRPRAFEESSPPV